MTHFFSPKMSQIQALKGSPFTLKVTMFFQAGYPSMNIQI